MSKKSGMGKFIAGAAIGVGLGILFAPKKGSETREKLKCKIQDMIDSVKEIDIDEVKEEFDNKIDEIKKELADLDKEKVLKIAKKKSEELKNKAQELVDLAVSKGTPILKDAANEVRLKTIDVTKEVLKRLEEVEI